MLVSIKIKTVSMERKRSVPNVVNQSRMRYLPRTGNRGIFAVVAVMIIFTAARTGSSTAPNAEQTALTEDWKKTVAVRIVISAMATPLSLPQHSLLQHSLL